MLAENKTTGHNRTIRLTNLTQINDHDLSELTIKLDYVVNVGAAIDASICLDRVVIPAIIAALNREHEATTKGIKRS